MANDIQLKRSSVSGKVPDAANVLVGEPVVNLADKIIYTKNATGTVIVVGAGTTSNISEGTNLYFTNARVSSAISSQTLTNATFSGEVVTNSILKSLQSIGDEGGELLLANAVTNSSLNGPIAIDIYQNKLRIFETTGNNRGAYLDFTTASNGVGTNLLGGSSSASWSVKTSNYTAASGDLIIADTSSGSFTITLPSSPTSGSAITIADGNNWSVANVIIARNSSTIEDIADNLSLDIAAITVDLIYDGTTWQVFSSTGGKELTETGVTDATYGGATFIPVIEVDRAGRILSASNVAVVGGVSSVGGATGNVSNAQLYASFESAVPPGTTGNVLVSNGTDWVSQAITSGATLSNDTTTNFNYMIGMANATSGSWTTAYTSNTKLYFNPSTGTLNSTIFNSLSDVQVKENIQPLTSGLDIVEKINPVSFIWRENKKPSFGVIAQQIEQVLPEIVDTNEQTGNKSVSYTQIIPFLIQAVKELRDEIKILKGDKQ